MMTRDRFAVGAGILTLAVFLAVAASFGNGPRVVSAPVDRSLVSTSAAPLVARIGNAAERDAIVAVTVTEAPNGGTERHIITTWSDQVFKVGGGPPELSQAKQDMAVTVCRQAQSLWPGDAISVLSRTGRTVFAKTVVMVLAQTTTTAAFCFSSDGFWEMNLGAIYRHNGLLYSLQRGQ